MKWLAAAAGVLVAGGVSLLFIAPREGRETPTAPQPVPSPVATTIPAPRIAVAVAPRPQPLGGVTLHGVLLRGARSQALLTVDGQPQQAYGIGDVVKPGWSVQAIREQQVVLANGSTSSELGVAAAAPGLAADQGAASPVAAGNSPARLPGFVTGAAAPMDNATASERNRRFLDAVRSKARTPP